MFHELIQDLKRDEGWKASAYQDHLGYWTIGYGFLVDERKGGTLPREVAEYWLEYAVKQRWDAFCLRHVWVQDQPWDVQRALANQVYQMGVEGVSNFRNMLTALQEGDRVKAAKEALDSRWAIQTPARAARVAALMRGNDALE